MTFSIRLAAADKALLEQAASILHISKSYFIRRSVAAYATKVIPAEQAAAQIDALYLGQGGGLRQPETITNPVSGSSWSVCVKSTDTLVNERR